MYENSPSERLCSPRMPNHSRLPKRRNHDQHASSSYFFSNLLAHFGGIVGTSLRLDAGGLDDRAEALDAVADERAEFFRRAADHSVAVVLDLGTHVRAVQRLDDLGIEAGDDLGRQAGRPQEAEPSGRLAKSRKDFGDRRNVGQTRITRRLEDGEKIGRASCRERVWMEGGGVAV